MDEHILPVVKHKFPLQVVIGNDVTTFNTFEDMPEGVAFKIYKAPKKESKILNTGVARVWSSSAVD